MVVVVVVRVDFLWAGDGYSIVRGYRVRHTQGENPTSIATACICCVLQQRASAAVVHSRHKTKQLSDTQ